MIVFLSDNGWMQGEHRIPGDKFLPYEESLRVPLIIRGPGVPKGQTVQGQVSNIDFAPTLLDVADAKAGRTHGRRLAAADDPQSEAAPRTGRSRSRRSQPLFAVRRSRSTPGTGPTPGVRTDRYTYVVWTETGEKELYDRKTDPYQLDNVAGDPAYATVEADLAGEAAKLDRLPGAMPAT